MAISINILDICTVVAFRTGSERQTAVMANTLLLKILFSIDHVTLALTAAINTLILLMGFHDYHQKPGPVSLFRRNSRDDSGWSSSGNDSSMRLLPHVAHRNPKTASCVTLHMHLV